MLLVCVGSIGCACIERFWDKNVCIRLDIIQKLLGILSIFLAQYFGYKMS